MAVIGDTPEFHVCLCCESPCHPGVPGQPHLSRVAPWAPCSGECEKCSRSLAGHWAPAVDSGSPHGVRAPRSDRSGDYVSWGRALGRWCLRSKFADSFLPHCPIFLPTPTLIPILDPFSVTPNRPTSGNPGMKFTGQCLWVPTGSEK